MKKLLAALLAVLLSASPALAIYGGTVNQGAAASSGPWIETPWIAGAVNSATNGLYFNLLQGNAVLSTGNPIFAQITAGSATIGAVTQASGPWTSNITQVGGATLALGQTTMASSIPVAIASNQSTLGVNTAQVNGVTTLTGAGATGTGAQRVTVSQDTTTIAGSAPGTAGTPSTNVVSVQGVASGTPIIDNLTQINGVALGSPTAWGTVPSGNVAGVNADTFYAYSAESTASWTSATGGNTALTLTTQSYNTVLVTLNQGSTISGGVVTFEQSDTTGFTVAYPMLCQNLTSGAQAASYTLVASTNIAFSCPVAGAAAMRVRLSTVITGSATVAVGMIGNSGPTAPIVSANQAGSPWGVNTAQVNGVTTLTGAGATGTGAQRVTVSQDTTTIAGSAVGTAGSASSNVVTVQGIASGTVIPANVSQIGGATLALGQTTMASSIPVAIASNQSTLSANTAQVNGVTTLTGAGATGTGSQRVTVAQDTGTIAGSAVGTAGSASSNVVTVQGVASMTPVNENLTQIAGSNVSTAATGVQKVGATGNAGVALDQVLGSAAPANALQVGAVTAGNTSAIVQGNTTVAINISTATTTQIIALASSNKIYVTAWNVIAGGTGNFTWEYGTGSSCGTGTTTLSGAYPLVANMGISAATGLGPVLVVPAGNALCAVTSANVQYSGYVTYTQSTVGP